MDSILIYDCEIRKAILGKNETPIEGIEYAAGWRDFANMGISCIGAYDYCEQRYRVFFEDNFAEFQNLVDNREIIVSFNGIGFDNPLCQANGLCVPDEKSYDELVELWIAAGLGPAFVYPTHVGYGLDAVCKANFGKSKTGYGGFAPVWWQRGEYGKLVDYCINDVVLEKRLFDLILHDGKVLSPINPDVILNVRHPINVE